MQFLIVLAAALACAIAEPQFAYTGYTGGVVPAVGYTGYTSGVGYTGAVAYAAPLTYGAHSVATYPVGYRVRRDVPASTTKLESVLPIAYPYGAPLVKSATPYTYSPVAYSTVGAYPYPHPHAYGYPGSVVTY